jgi:undecaprenyl diphosphate synthase
MKDYKALLDPGRIPAHVAVIMDGNGRWAKKKSLSRLEGHRRGAETVEPVVDAAARIGVKYISLFAFSTENWNRPRDEVAGLWKLLELFFKSKIESILQKGVKVVFSGSFQRLPASTGRIIDETIRRTRTNSKITLNFCINYGGRQEIVDGVNAWLKKGGPGEKLTEKKLGSLLYNPKLPDVDLMIRTSGEYRISNFMLWQLAYAELVFMNVLWPDFRASHLYRAVYEYQHRERRFGGL